MGKSSAVSSLLEIMKNKFDLIIAFIGSASCNPVLKEQMFQNWDDRFFFSQWEQALIDALLKQQESLKMNGITRNVGRRCPFERCGRTVSTHGDEGSPLQH